MIEKFEETRIATILGVKKEDGRAKYLIKFDDNELIEEIESSLAAKRWTDTVIDFLQKKIEWVPSNENCHRAPPNRPIKLSRGNSLKKV